MELRQLRYFVAVADTLNFSRAAESLYVSQPALSKQICDLEQEMGIPLFIRDKRNVELTSAGRLLLTEAKSILMQSEKIIPYLRHKSSSSTPERSLHIAVEPRAADDPVIHRALVEAVYQQRQNTPGLRTLFWREEFTDIKKMLLGGVWDMGIFLNSSRSLGETLKTEVLCEDEMVLVFRGQHLYTDDRESILELLNKRGVILLDKEPRGMAQIFSILESIKSSPQIRFCQNRTSMVLTMESGESAAILPYSIARRLAGRNLQILHFQHPSAWLCLLAAWKPDTDNELVAQIIRNTLDILNLKK